MTLPLPSATALAAAFLLATSPALAQTPPDAGKLLRDNERNPAALPQATPPAPPAPPRADPAAAGPRVMVQGFRLSGVTLLPEAELQARLKPFVGQAATLADLQRAADAVAARYHEAGFLVRATLPEQALRDGVVTIAVLEGRLAAVRVERQPPARRIGEAQVRSIMTARQKIGEPVREADIQRAIGLLNALPGISASSLLEPGEQPGQTRLVVAVKDEPAITGQAQIDNAGSKASGEWRASGGLSLNSPFGYGDQAQFYASKSSGSAYGSAAWHAPLGHDGLRATVNASRLAYGYELSGSRYNGGATVWGGALSYPILRGSGASLSASLSHDRKAFDNAVAGIQLNDKTVKVSALGLSGDLADGLFGGGLSQFSITLGFGRLDLSGNPADHNADQVAGGPNREGSFRKTGWSLGRLQRLTAADSLQLTLAGQRASRNLDSSEKFGVTGVGAVRAYASSEPSADDGTLVSVEWRHQLGERLTLSVFRDQARLTRDHTANSATLSPNRFSLAGQGFGLAWNAPGQVLLRGSIAWRSGENPARNPGTGADADGTKRNPRAYISALKVF